MVVREHFLFSVLSTQWTKTLLGSFKWCVGCTHKRGQDHHSETLSTALSSPGFSHLALNSGWKITDQTK